MQKRLNSRETRQAIRLLGIDSSARRTFGVFDEARNVRYGFHSHRRHQLMFPVEGVLFVETKSAFYPCSPGHGIWIPAGVRHSTTTGSHATVSVFFDDATFPLLRDHEAMVKITPLLRETGRRAGCINPSSARPMVALFQVIYEELAANLHSNIQLTLPAAKSPLMQRAVGFAFQSLSSITVSQLAKQSGQSERSMRRRFLEEMGMGPEFYIQRARLIRGMHLLVENRRSAVTEIALEVGYRNHSAFTSAFHRFTGLTPKAFRAMSLPTAH